MIYSNNKTYTGCKTPKDLSEYMNKNIGYANFRRLKSAQDVIDTKKGSCHDQVMFELHELKAMGLHPKALFFMEYNNRGNGGMTHSFVYYEYNNKVYWFENAWESNRGIHEFNSLNDIKKSIIDMHNTGEFGNKHKYPELEFDNFGSHKPGETLQEFVDICVG